MSSALGLHLGATVWHLHRLRLADDEPMLVGHTYLPLEMFGSLTHEKVISHSLYDLLESEFDQTIKTAEEEVRGRYEHHIGGLIVERFRGLDPDAVPGVLAAGHGPFAWGPDPRKAVENAVALEAVLFAHGWQALDLAGTTDGGIRAGIQPRGT